MPTDLVYIFGAPGSGTTTLGAALALYLGVPHFDTDNYYWITDDALPYRRKRNTTHRRELLLHDLAQHPRAVLSGSVAGWADELKPFFRLVVFMVLPASVRLPRIQLRETERYGAGRIGPGGDLHGVFETFLNWAEAYERLGVTGQRNRERDEQWLSDTDCPVVYIIEDDNIAHWVAEVAGALNNLPGNGWCGKKFTRK